MPETPSLKNLYSDFGKVPKKINKYLKTLGEPHVESFNFLLKSGLDLAVKDLQPVEFQVADGDIVKFALENFQLNSPAVPAGTIGVKNPLIYPTECRQSATTYKGRLVGHLRWWINGNEQTPIRRDFGEIPIMLKSDACNLSKMSPKDLVTHSEHENEWGGYFIVKGHERLIRMLLQQRRNYPIAVVRSSWKGKDACFSDLGIMLRSVREDESANNNVLHYVTDGTAKLRIAYNRALYYIPVVLVIKSLADVTDEFIYDKIMAGHEDDLFFKGCVLNMLRQVHDSNIHTHQDAILYLGRTLRIKVSSELPPWTTDVQVAKYILRKTVCIHLDNDMDKVNLLVMMIQKLLCFAQGKCRAEGVDCVMMQELLLGGHLYLQLLKARLQMWMVTLKYCILKKNRGLSSGKLSLVELQNNLRKVPSLENTMSVFLATGNLPSQINVQQDKGLTIVAENINRMRYMSHFRSVHRGSFFQEMRTTEARQLLPDAWGFICPVHTPDGTPCGLLNHLSKHCQVTTSPDASLVKNIPTILSSLGMIPLNSPLAQTTVLKECCVVMLDGRILGHVHKNCVGRLVDKLRVLKIKGEQVPNTLEIAHIPMKSCMGTQYPGLYLFTGPARMMRPVLNLACKQIELIGTLEQVYMDICITPEEAYKGLTTHMEISKIAFLSNLACLIPMPDLNQSPRNMYQCQMGKQTMGTPCHTFNIQSETKLYRLQTPTSPLFRPAHYDEIGLDDFGMGTNAIVAVVSYTGYDMEDAMILNKSSVERGFAAGSILKCEIVELPNSDSYFARDPAASDDVRAVVDEDGMVFPGTRLQMDTPLCSFYNTDVKKYIVKKFHGAEEGWVQSVRQCASMSSAQPSKAVILYTVQRNPSVGDKFASRAGQKGILSQKWASEDLPFTESGLVPDIVFNPHGFPSRMTIAMMVELMAGKAAAVHGFVQDATPFRFTEDDTAIDYCGRLLEAAGYNYYGTEKMYSGVDGREMNASIFFGVVHYQRLRHMVSDKWQVRSTGPVDSVTHQPIKGRRRGGGVRFGEMERDGLLSHGASFLLQDRLFHCSDKEQHKVCRTCGTMLGPYLAVSAQAEASHGRVMKCRMCGEKGDVVNVLLPHIYKCLVAQMSSMNINLKMELTEGGE